MRLGILNIFLCQAQKEVQVVVMEKKEGDEGEPGKGKKGKPVKGKEEKEKPSNGKKKGKLGKNAQDDKLLVILTSNADRKR